MKTKTKEELIREHQELNKEFISKMGKENVVAIAIRMCQIEEELYEKYNFKLFDDE